LSPEGLRRWRAASYFEIEFRCVASRNTFVLFEKVDFVTGPATRVTFPKPNAVPLPNGKGIVLVLVAWTTRAFLYVLA
jgi:hypothetical protein